MAWCNDPEERSNGLISPSIIITPKPNNNTDIKPYQEIRNITCPSCGHTIEFQDQGGINELPGLPVGMKFDPNDQEILEHLEAKVVSDVRKIIHPLIDEFIPTLEGDNGICYTHPEKLPGVSKDGQIRHFFHRPSKAYTTGTRKRRKVHTDEEGSETRWHKTGKTRAILVDGEVKGFKKILVLYTNYGRQKKPEKTYWIMHQYHLGSNEQEKDGELVVSKVFYQTQPRQCGNNNYNNSITIKDPYDEGIVPKNVVVPLDYYNAPNYMNNYEHVGDDNDNRESSSPQLLFPNLVVQGGDHGGSSFFRFAMDHGNNKARLERK